MWNKVRHLLTVHVTASKRISLVLIESRSGNMQTTCISLKYIYIYQGILKILLKINFLLLTNQVEFTPGLLRWFLEKEMVRIGGRRNWFRMCPMPRFVISTVKPSSSTSYHSESQLTKFSRVPFKSAVNSQNMLKYFYVILKTMSNLSLCEV